MASVWDPTSGQFIEDTSFAGQTDTNTQPTDSSTSPEAATTNISPPAPTGNSFRFGSGDYQAPPEINLSDPNQLALTGLTAAQRTTPQYDAFVTNSPRIDDGGSGTLTNQLTGTYEQQVTSPKEYQSNHPELQFTYNPIQDSADTTLGYGNYQPLDSNVAVGTATTYADQYGPPGFNPASGYSATQAQTAQGTVDPNSLYGSTNARAAQGQVAAGSTYDAAQGDTVHGEVDPRSMMQNQFSELTAGVLDGNVPDWARTAVTAARQQANASGLGNSTMALGATTAAIFNVALPMAQFNASVIAEVNKQNIQNAQAMIQFNTAAKNSAMQFNASVVGQLNLANLQNAQQANMANAAFANDASKYNASVAAQLNLQNLQDKQQTLLANASFDNAAKQFNAQNEQQNNQYWSSLVAQVQAQNADRVTAVRQFNTGQLNSMTQFTENLRNSRLQFNAQNGLLIDQSNVQWRRTLNTANTAGQNAANQANVQNLFNLSSTAQNQLWQQARDEASWALTSSENSQNRLLSLVNSALNRQTSLQILASQLNANTFAQLGGLAGNLLSGGSLGSLANLFSGSGSGGLQGTDGGSVGGSAFDAGGGSDFVSSLGGGDFGGGFGGGASDFG